MKINIQWVIALCFFLLELWSISKPLWPYQTLILGLRLIYKGYQYWMKEVDVDEVAFEIWLIPLQLSAPPPLAAAMTFAQFIYYTYKYVKRKMQHIKRHG